MSKGNIEAERMQLAKIIGRRGAHLHFAGICGISMSALAEYFHRRGLSISGSDADTGEMRLRLASLGIPISLGNSAEYITGADALIITSALPDTAPEFRYAMEQGIPVYTRAELLGALMMGYPSRIGISGTHGKSTTTAMIQHIFLRAGCRYTALVGAAIYDGTGLSLDGDEGIIYEGCEYRDAFLSFSPTTAVVTGVELDHTDYFTDTDALVASFRRAVSVAECVIINADYPTTAEICRGLNGSIIRYGVDKSADYRYNIISSGIGGTRAEIYHRAEPIGELYLPTIGEHNVANATAAIAAAIHHGISAGEAISALADFRGVSRRLEYLGMLGRAPVYYDYAHHPTEIASTIAAVRGIYGSLCVLFRPHTYSRTRDLWCDFVSALSLADDVIITDIYPAREAEVEGITAERLAEDIGTAKYIPFSHLYDHLLGRGEDAAPVVIMGAGDMSELVKRLRKILHKDKEI